MAEKFSAIVLTLFPEMFPGPLGHSLAGKALEDGLWNLKAIDIRGFAADRHRTVDDSPSGGGAGMVMRPDVLDDAIGASYPGTGPLIYFTPRGATLTQARVKALAAEETVTLICGRFEGVDQRVLDARQVEEISLGDFVLSGGELAALTLLDAVVRLLPGVVGKNESLEDESFETGLLEYPHYTRPDPWKDMGVPDVLKSGHHAKVATWRREQAEAVTKERRPDLWAKYVAQKAPKT